AWALALRPALRHPAAAVLVTTAALLLIASPTLGMHTRLMGFGDLPRQLKVVHSYEQIQHAFPGAQTPAVVAVQAADVEAPAVQHGIARLRALAAASPQLRGPVSVQVNARHDLAKVEVPLAGDGDEGRSIAALTELRERVLPASIGRVPGASFAVTGETAGTHQFTEVTKHHWPVVFAFVLSMDYHVFIVSRIKELADRGASTEDAVARGIAGTAGTVTAAAAVMVAVFA